MTRGALVLEDGTTFGGRSVGAPATVWGEAVFTTTMTGYQEALTDPSFHGQLVCFTAPMVGNYGVADHRTQSPRARAGGTVMRSCTSRTWAGWLARQGIVALADVDTRRLATHLRERGTMRAALASDVRDDAAAEALAARAAAMSPVDWQRVVADVSTPAAYRHREHGRVDVGIVDFGCKRSLLDLVAAADAAVTVHPHDVEPGTLRVHDLVVLSSGPGDPAALLDATERVRAMLGTVPVVGVCLGHQLLAQALGHDTVRLPFGHRGGNHPVLDQRSGRVLVTSQNHGYAVRLDPTAGGVTHVSLYDGTVEGLAAPELAAAGVQFHPEATPGPHDARSVLHEWIEEAARAA